MTRAAAILVLLAGCSRVPEVTTNNFEELLDDCAGGAFLGEKQAKWCKGVPQALQMLHDQALSKEEQGTASRYVNCDRAMRSIILDPRIKEWVMPLCCGGTEPVPWCKEGPQTIRWHGLRGRPGLD
jgi:hypothetical protein